jgi:threonine dehydratase
MTKTKITADVIRNMYHRFASPKFSTIIAQTPLQYNEQLSSAYGHNVYFKREDLQPVRSFKVRGAAAAISSLTDDEIQRGVVCASAGNHAQGVAHVSSSLGIQSDIFIPYNTPLQKQQRIEHFNGDNRVHQSGNTLDECLQNARDYAETFNKSCIHPFDDVDTIIGQGTLGVEIVNQCSAIECEPDIIIGCIGGGGLMSGVGTYVKNTVPSCKIVSAEPDTCASFEAATKKDQPVSVNCVDTFVDGASVSQIGDIPFAICSEVVDENVVVPVGQLCSDVLDAYDRDGIILEPAGALSLSALHTMMEAGMSLENSHYGTRNHERKNIVCILSGGNNDLSRYPEIIERSQLWKRKKHYYVVSFAQKPGELLRFVTRVLGPSDDISRFEYVQKNNRETGAVLIGITVRQPEDIGGVETRMKEELFSFEPISTDVGKNGPSLFGSVLV